MSNKAMSDCEQSFSHHHRPMTSPPRRQLPAPRLYMTDNKNSHGFLLEMNDRFSDTMDHHDFNTVQHEFSRSSQPHDLTLTSMLTPRN